MHKIFIANPCIYELRKSVHGRILIRLTKADLEFLRSFTFGYDFITYFCFRVAVLFYEILPVLGKFFCISAFADILFQILFSFLEHRIVKSIHISAYSFICFSHFFQRLRIPGLDIVRIIFCYSRPNLIFLFFSRKTLPSFLSVCYTFSVIDWLQILVVGFFLIFFRLSFLEKRLSLIEQHLTISSFFAIYFCR